MLVSVWKMAFDGQVCFVQMTQDVAEAQNTKGCLNGNYYIKDDIILKCQSED